MSKKIVRSRFPEDDATFDKLGIKRNQIEPWEDGMRTTGRKGWLMYFGESGADKRDPETDK